MYYAFLSFVYKGELKVLYEDFMEKQEKIMLKRRSFIGRQKYKLQFLKYWRRPPCKRCLVQVMCNEKCATFWNHGKFHIYFVIDPITFMKNRENWAALGTLIISILYISTWVIVIMKLFGFFD